VSILTLGEFYALAGALMIATALRVALDAGHPRRWGLAAFWGLLGLTFIFGNDLPPTVVGYLVLGSALLAATGNAQGSREPTTSQAERAASAARLGNRLFWPALLVPATALVGSLLLGQARWHGHPLADPANRSVIFVCAGSLIALAAAVRVTRSPLGTAVGEGSRLLQTVGWALILPQALAALGGLFTRAGVGAVVAGLVERALPTQYAPVAVAAYCVGMFLFTLCMGNAFAAFAVVTGGIGVPLIVQAHGGNPAIVAALGMLSGFCGTLLTPMAANFNLVPAMLLELEDKNAVIKAQAPIAVALLGFNLLLMEFCVYRF
jgi:uncharacterized membrane protein